MYLAEKTGKFLPQDMRKRYEVIQWLMFQMGGVGPMFGQANFFYPSERKSPLAIDRYHKEALRLSNFWISSSGRRITSPASIRLPILPRILGLASRNASSEIGGVSERETLVRRHLGTARSPARDAVPKPAAEKPHQARCTNASLQVTSCSTPSVVDFSRPRL